MRVLMLGWEFPPFISGGLGTACFGLTKALSARGTEITFVLPKPVGSHHASHVRLLSPDTLQDFALLTGALSSTERSPSKQAAAPLRYAPIDAPLSAPYPAGTSHGGVAARGHAEGLIGYIDGAFPGAGSLPEGFDSPYEHDTIAQARRYAARCLTMIEGQDFELIHAHDWPTFPAAIALSATTGKPWVAHIHSTEFDRSGEHASPQIYDIERHGMHEADRVVTVSAFTKAVCVERYAVNAAKIEVVYNGADAQGKPATPLPNPPDHSGAVDKIVLFLGRITEQKGPEHFVEAAGKVLEKYDRVKFIMAGAGDLARKIIEKAAQAGIGHRFMFTGFLRGDEIDKVFDMADVYVMPSVSEPFGIAPLEAINHQVPVIISRQSGVSEVLRHALKVDFWDTNDLADKIIAVLKHPPLGEVLRSNALIEVQELTWDGAADRCQRVYEHTLASVTR